MAAAKGFRLPGDWALTSSLLDYRQGFVRRALLGELYARLHVFHARRLTAVFCLELACAFAGLVLLTRRSGLATRFQSQRVITLFAGSFVVTFLTHMLGYSDIVNLTLTLLLLLVTDARKRLLLALPVVAVALLIHEDYLLLFAPVLLFSVLLQAVISKDLEERRRLLAYLAVVAAIATLIAARIVLRPSTTPLEANAIALQMQGRSGFSIDPNFVALLSSRLPDTLRAMKEVRQTDYWKANFYVSLLILLPPLAFWCHLIRRILRSQAGASRGFRATLGISAVVSIVAPIALNLVGWDQVRWHVMCVLNAFLVLNLFSMHLPCNQLRLSTTERNVMLVLIVIGIASGQGLMDGVTPNAYPYFFSYKF